MKHLLNNLSEEEKNRIREQHEGGMKVNTEKFKSLLESKLGNAKPLLSEAAIESEMGSLLNQVKSMEKSTPIGGLLSVQASGDKITAKPKNSTNPPLSIALSSPELPSLRMAGVKQYGDTIFINAKIKLRDIGNMGLVAITKLGSITIDIYDATGKVRYTGEQSEDEIGWTGLSDSQAKKLGYKDSDDIILGLYLGLGAGGVTRILDALQKVQYKPGVVSSIKIPVVGKTINISRV